jgi:hypothetical protein
MATINAKNYSTPKNINLKEGLLRFGGTFSTNRLDSTSNGLYVNSSNELVFAHQGTATILSGTGPIVTPSWDAIFANDQTFNLAGLATFTIDNSTGNNDVLTITNTGAGSGDCIQITNVGTGSDIKGTSGTWSFSKAGVNTMKSTTIAGTAGSDSITLTAGDMVLSDGSLTITDADDAATLSITNNTATSASVFVFAGSGVFTGSTTTSFMTITPSGLTTGTAVYLPVAGLTTGKAIHVVADAATTGTVVQITSSATAITGNGRLLSVVHSGATGTTATLNEFSTAANDETVLLKLTASSTLALGTVLSLSASSMTTGKGLGIIDLDALTTGIGLHIASAATAITTTGRLLYVNHTGTTGTSATLAEIASAATDETVILTLTASAALALGTALNISVAALTTGSGIAVGTLAALTTGKGISVQSSATAITTTGRLFYSNHSGATTTSGTLNEFASAANDETVIVKITASDVLAAGTALGISLASMTTGTGIGIGTLAALTTGIALSIASSATAITGAGRLVYVNHTGATGTSAVLNEFASAATDETVVLRVTASAALAAGVLVDLSAAAATTATILKIEGLAALTTGKAISVAHTTSVIANGGTLLSLSSSGIDTATTSGCLVNLSSTASTSGTQVLGTFSVLTDGIGVSIVAAATTSGTLLKLSAVEATLTTGLYIQCYDGAANDFSVGKYGATIIAGNASGTAALTVNAGDIVITSGFLVLSANAKGVTFTGTGSNGGVLKNLKNTAASGLSGTQKDIEIDIAGVPYYFTVYPTKA